MPNTLLADSISLELEAQDPLPQNIILYQPYEVEQILLPDNANCLAVQAFLKMCDLKFKVEPRTNAEYMSPSGRVPFIKCGAFLISEFDNIVSFIGHKGISLSDHLSPASKADMRAYMSLVNNVFVNAELYICWVDETTLNEVTKGRHGSAYPWPLNHFLNWQKRKEVIKKLNILGWYNKTIEDVCNEVKNCCTALSVRLEGSDYFSGEKPTEIDALVCGHIYALSSIKVSLPTNVQEIVATVQEFPNLLEHASRSAQNYLNFTAIQTPNELDALVFGHIFTIITTPLPGNHLASIIQSYPQLVHLLKRIETRYFQRSED
ncbi:Metaxin-2 [Habropoda laboriosa]|uniref:Metaxin-2 n=1 Tax=Habropoda laboriosa TaxID=597456 RepID=A0A0L7RF64_9HYME|nr:Metaxin-2 [Habropoda laboriosa]